MTQNELDWMCDEGYALKDRGDLDAALDMWRRAAARGSGRAMNILGAEAHARGDLGEAKRLFSLAVAASPPDVWAMFNLGVFAYQDGDNDLAMHYFEQSGENGHVDGAHNRAQMAMQQQDMDTAHSWWRRAAELGHMEAPYNLGISASRQGDTTGARMWFERAAELGHAEGMNRLGAALLDEGNHSDAVELYKRAASAGSTSAMHNLSALAEGKYQYAEAMAWMQQAADTGDERAARELSRQIIEAHLQVASDVPALSRPDLVAHRQVILSAAYQTDLADSERQKYFATYVQSMCEDVDDYRELEERIDDCGDSLLLSVVIPNLDSRSSNDDPEWDDCAASVLRNPATERSIILEQAHAAQRYPGIYGTQTEYVLRAAINRADISYLDLSFLISAFLTSDVEDILFAPWDCNPKEYSLESLNNAFLEFQHSHPLSEAELAIFDTDEFAQDMEDGEFEEADLVALASHPMTPTSMLRDLAVCANPDVRRLVSENPSSDDETRAITAILK